MNLRSNSNGAARLGPSPAGPARRLLANLVHDFDAPDDVLIERVELRGRNPIFRMRLSASLLDGMTAQERRIDREPRDVSDAARFHVPIARDLDRIFLLDNRVED